MTLRKKNIPIETKKMLKLVVIVTLGIFFITGCDSGGSSDGNGEGVEITAKSIGLEGTWESDCRKLDIGIPQYRRLDLKAYGSEMGFGFTDYSNESCTLKHNSSLPKYSFTLHEPITTPEGLTAYPLEASNKSTQKISKYLIVVQGDKLFWTFAAHNSNEYPSGLSGSTREFLRVK
jgi:hypothetical protein